MNKFKIEKNVPIPSRAGRSKYPFEQMDKGDSFLIAATDKKAVASARSSVYSAAAKRKLKVVTRIEEKGLRVWMMD